MATARAKPKNIDAYIAAFSPDVQTILELIRLTIHNAAPDAQETISYQMPAFTQHGILVYFAAFKNHIGLYPPVSGDAKLEKAISPYAGEKGNLRFPLSQPIPYDLIERIVKLRVEQNLAKAAAKKKETVNHPRTAPEKREAAQGRLSPITKQNRATPER